MILIIRIADIRNYTYLRISVIELLISEVQFLISVIEFLISIADITKSRTNATLVVEQG